MEPAADSSRQEGTSGRKLVELAELAASGLNTSLDQSGSFQQFSQQPQQSARSTGKKLFVVQKQEFLFPCFFFRVSVVQWFWVVGIVFLFIGILLALCLCTVCSVSISPKTMNPSAHQLSSCGIVFSTGFVAIDGGTV